MSKLIKVTVIFIMLMASCSLPIRIPNVMGAEIGGEIVEGFAYYCGKIFVVKSISISGAHYWQSSTKIPAKKRVWMEIYIARGGHIVLFAILNAKLISANPERWRFENFKVEDYK